MGTPGQSEMGSTWDTRPKWTRNYRDIAQNALLHLGQTTSERNSARLVGLSLLLLVRFGRWLHNVSRAQPQKLATNKMRTTRLL